MILRRIKTYWPSMFWKSRKRRPRGPETPQARALNWRIFLNEEAAALGALHIPEIALNDQVAFEEFLRVGYVSDLDTPRTSEQIRALTWRYRLRTKRRFGPTFLEHDPGAVSRISRDELFELLRRGSTLWGTNEQPANVESFAAYLSTLPIYTATMPKRDTLVLTFLRPLTNEESEHLIHEARQEQSPFIANEPHLEAHLWWD